MQKLKNLAKERAASKDNYGIDAKLNCHNLSLIFMAKKIGIALGCSVSMIGQNLDVTKKLNNVDMTFTFEILLRKNIGD